MPKPIRMARIMGSVFKKYPMMQAEKARTWPIERSIPSDRTTTVRPDARRKTSED